MIPALGTVADALNTAVYLAQGDLANAAMSAISLIPLGGAVAAAGALFAKYGDEVIQGVVKYGDDVVEAVAKNGDEATDIVKLCKNGNCFVAGTLILTAEGYKAIEDIEEGDTVISTDPETGETTEKKVVETFVNETDELIYLTVNGEEIITTPTHPFYVPEKDWTDAEDLRAGDMLVLVNGNYVVIERTEYEILETPITVYNFEVEDFHTYFVGEQSLLVHNLCGDATDVVSTVNKNGANALETNKIPDNDSVVGHIFRDAEGHIPDTPENRALLENTSNNMDNFRGKDKYGNEWYTMDLEDGGQVWTEARNGNIFDGGINKEPKPWNPSTGLKKL